MPDHLAWHASNVPTWATGHGSTGCRRSSATDTCMIDTIFESSSYGTGTCMIGTIFESSRRCPSESADVLSCFEGFLQVRRRDPARNEQRPTTSSSHLLPEWYFGNGRGLVSDVPTSSCRRGEDTHSQSLAWLRPRSSMYESHGNTTAGVAGTRLGYQQLPGNSSPGTRCSTSEDDSSLGEEEGGRIDPYMHTKADTGGLA